MNKIWFYLRKLWHQYIACDIFILLFTNKNELGEILKTKNGESFEVLWEEKEGKYWRYWVRNSK